MKKSIRIFLRILVTPALFIHELSHVIACLIVGLSPRSFGWNFYLNQGPIHAEVYFDEEAYKNIEGSFRKFFIDIAPLFPFIYTGFMATNMVLFQYILLYEFIVFPFSFLSVVDINNALRYLGFKKEVSLFYLRWDLKFHNWLYFEGLTSEEYYKKCELDMIEM